MTSLLKTEPIKNLNITMEFNHCSILFYFAVNASVIQMTINYDGITQAS